MKLIELLDTKQEVDWEYDEFQGWQTSFITKSKNQYQLFLHDTSVIGDYETFLDDFKRMFSDKISKEHWDTFWDKVLDDIFVIEFVDKDWQSSVTGAGSAAEVFGIVGNALRDLMKKKQPTALMFQGEEESRNRLYTRLANMFSKEFNYTVFSDRGIYWLIRKDFLNNLK